MSSGLQPSTRIKTGVFMLVGGVMLGMIAILLVSVLGFLAVIPLFGGPIVSLVGVAQMIRGVRERATPRRVED